MKIGITEIIESGCYGMPGKHMHAIAHVAAENDTVISVRPVNKYAFSLLNDGNPTKSFCVKNKSSNIGPMAGLIAINPLYSRVSENEYDKHNKQLAKAFHHDAELKAIPLTLTETRLHELEKLLGSAITIHTINNATESTPAEYSMSWRKGDNRQIRVIARKNAQTGKLHIFDEENNPLHVLGRTIVDDQGIATDLPITADYDLLVVCPSHKHFEPGNFDKSPFRTQPGMKNNSLEENQAKVNESTKEEYQGPTEDPNGGNWSPRVKHIVKKINHQIKETDQNRQHKHCETMHHNAEFNNPFADDLNNHFPALIVFPNEMDLTSISGRSTTTKSNIVLIETAEEMINIRAMLIAQGYYWTSHAKYKDVIKPFHAHAVKAASEGVEILHKMMLQKQNRNQHQANDPFPYEDSVDVTKEEMTFRSDFGRNSKTAKQYFADNMKWLRIPCLNQQNPKPQSNAISNPASSLLHHGKRK